MAGTTDTIIVGGGQAGLSVARYLKRHGIPFLILEKNESIGVSWKERYDSLILDSFVKYSHLEGFPFKGDPSRQAGKEEVSEYLKEFAHAFNLHPEFSTEVISIKKNGDMFSVATDKKTYEAKHVVLATGPFHKPHIPENYSRIPSRIFQIHSKDYRNPKELKDGPVLVVGGGNSGAEIAEELAQSGRKVYFSFKRKFQSVKSSPFSQWLAYRIGLAHAPKDTLVGKLVRWYTKGKAVGVDVKKLLKHPNLVPVGSYLGVENGEFIFDKGRIKEISNIIWATGYESDFSIVSIPDFDPKTHKRGVSNVPGLYLLNIRWQFSKSSSHLAGISRDARYIASEIARDILKNNTL